MRPEDDPVVGFFVQRLAHEPPAASPCPDDNVLMGLAGGGLFPTERERLDAHLACCARCRDVAGVLARMQDDTHGVSVDGARRRDERRSRSVRQWLVAAVALLALAGAIAVPSLWRRLGLGVHPFDTEAALVATARTLADSRPDLFEGFVPLTRGERRAPSPQLRAGDLALLYPAGKIFEPRPTFRWEAAADVEDEIVLRTAKGERLWRGKVKAPVHDFPAGVADLEPGTRYRWEVSRDGARYFARASAAEQGAFEECDRAIAASVAAPMRSLVTSHLALRHEYLGEAERAARAYVAARPTDAVGRETLCHVLRLLGSAEAEQLAAALDGPR